MAKILIAEDESAIARMMARAVESLGHTTVLCDNGRKARELLEADNGFDLLITDVRMPEMNGLDLICHVRRTPSLRNIPAIIVSGKVTVNEISEYLDMGASCFLGKPVDLNDLRRYVSLLLNRHLSEAP